AASIGEYAGGEASDTECKWLVERMFYLQGDFDDPAAYARLGELLAKTQKSRAISGNALFYLATPPHAFARIVRRLADCGPAREEEGRWRRVVVEKPFGSDLRSAQALNRELLSVLHEAQIYRIDHYL